MKITDVKITLCHDEKLKAYATVTLDDCFVIHGLKVIRGREQTFIAMPNRRLKDGSYQDIAHPINAQTRRWLEDTVLKAYRESVEGYYQLGDTPAGSGPFLEGLNVSDGLCERLKTGVLDEIRSLLVDAARRGDTVSYDQIVETASRALSLAVCRDDVDHILCELSAREHRAGRPLLSAAVVESDTDQPDWSFFALARHLGTYGGDADQSFHTSELERLHSFWSSGN